MHDLNSITLEVSSDNKAAIVVSDASVKSNNVTTSVAHIHSYNNPVRKTVYHAINIISIEAELFVLRCRINQAIHISDIFYITDVIHIVEKIFNMLNYPF